MRRSWATHYQVVAAHPGMKIVMRVRDFVNMEVKLVEAEVPVRAQPIFARMRRLLFNTPLARDLDALARMQAQLRQARRLPRDLLRLRELELGTITIPGEFMEDGATKAGPAQLIGQLHAAGHAAAQAMLSPGEIP